MDFQPMVKNPTNCKEVADNESLLGFDGFVPQKSKNSILGSSTAKKNFNLFSGKRTIITKEVDGINVQSFTEQQKLDRDMSEDGISPGMSSKRQHLKRKA
jgi:hypothetical protein